MVAIVAGICLAGCVFPMVSKTTHRFIEREEIKFVEPGRSTQDDVKAQLGDPSLIVINPERWVYRLRLYETNRWGMCFAVPAGFGGFGDCGQISDGKEKVEYLYLEFDSSGKVTDISTHSVYGDECIEPGVCPGAAQPRLTGIYEGLEQRFGVYYETYSDEPFTGKLERRYPSGRLAEQLKLEDGLEDGQHKQWYETGQRKLVRQYRNGVRHGLERGWHENGTMSHRLRYIDGLFHGLVTAWQPDGTVILEACYQEGQIVLLDIEVCTD